MSVEVAENMRVKAAVGQPVDVPALVLGSGITALGVVRRLGRAGISVYCASRELELVAQSRWCKRTPIRLSRYEKLPPFLENLPFEKAVVFACSDDWVWAVAELEGELADRFPACQAAMPTIGVFLDKGKFAQALRRNNLPHPRTITLTSEDELEQLDDKEITGYFFKPCNSQAFSARYRVKAFRIASRNDALSRFRQLRQDGLEVVLQQYIPGPPTNHYFIDGYVDRTGRICALLARRRIRMYPWEFGNPSYMTTVPIEVVAAAVESVERLIAAVGYWGIFSAEFKLDPRDGTFKILEMNVRPYWYIEFTARCGVDLSRMAYDYARGVEVTPVEGYKVGVSCVNLWLDLSTSIRMIRRRELDVVSMLGSWLDAKQALFQWRDPLPAIVDSGRWVREKFAGLFSAQSAV